MGKVPLIVPVTELSHYVRKYDEPYLKELFFLNPHPLSCNSGITYNGTPHSLKKSRKPLISNPEISLTSLRDLRSVAS